jgi:hypothetical protein
MKARIFSSLMLVFAFALIFSSPAKAQCDRTYPDGAVVAHAMQDDVVRSFVMPYKQGNFWIGSVTVTATATGYFVAWTFEPACRYETPPCLAPTQIVCADLDCDLNVLAICVS